MELPQEVDDHIKNSIHYNLGLPVPDHALQLKLQSLEASNYRLRAQYLTMQFKLKQKDEALECARAEACLNAQALKRFVEDNQKLADECAHLVSQCSRWERECSLYDHDREALMEFGNEADERAKAAELRVHELEEELRRVSEEAGFYKQEIQRLSVDSSVSDGCASSEQNLLDGLIATLINRDEVTKTANTFLETNKRVDTCQKLLKMWNFLRPGTRNILSLAAQAQILQKDKEHLRLNLRRAEEEVKVLFEENKILDGENRRLLRQRNSERKHNGSRGKFNGSDMAKSNKRKSSPRISSPVERKFDFSDLDSHRQPLSPLQENSPVSRMHKR